MNFLTELFKAIGLGFLFATKAVKPDEIRIDNHRIEKVRIEENEMVKIFDNAFSRLRDHGELDIATNVKLVNDNLPDDQEAELIEQLTARIKAYRMNLVVQRRKFPRIWKKWLRNNDNQFLNS